MMEHLVIFFSFMILSWFIVTYFLPRILLSVYKKAILIKGFEDGPVPINTLYTQSQAQFADPLHTTGSYLATTGTNRDTLLTVGWLDLSKSPQILYVPDMAGRYYSIQLTNPSNNTNFAYVGKRATGTAAGTYLISGPSWKGTVPQGMAQISSPNNSVLIIARVFIGGDDDLTNAYELSKQIQLSSLARQ
jgi:hypothetical protein